MVKLICYTQSIQRKTIGDVEYGNWRTDSFLPQPSWNDTEVFGHDGGLCGAGRGGAFSFAKAGPEKPSGHQRFRGPGGHAGADANTISPRAPGRAGGEETG